MPLRVNLGSSDDLRPGYLSVDMCEPPRGATPDNFLQHDLNQRWPWEDGAVDEIVSHDCFEHLHGPYYPSNRGKIWVMNESWRVLRAGGILDLWVPCVYLHDGTVNPGAFADPTHVSFWTMDDIYYFGEEWNNQGGERGRLGPAYGITAVFHKQKWDLFEYGSGKERRTKIRAVLEAVK